VTAVNGRIRIVVNGRLFVNGGERANEQGIGVFIYGFRVCGSIVACAYSLAAGLSSENVNNISQQLVDDLLSAPQLQLIA
jgi:hypothetical protein